MKRIIVFILFMLVFCSSATAQRLVPTRPFGINVDYTRFRNDDASGYLEVYYAFFPSLLTYDYSEDRFHAGVNLATTLRESESGNVFIDEHYLLPMTVVDTADVAYRFPFITQAGYALPFGDYELTVTAVDSINTARRDSITLSLSIERYPESVSLSEIELCGNLRTCQDQNNAFYKNSLEVVPNPTLIFGVTAYPVLFHYVELYNIDPEESYTIVTEVVDQNGKVIKESTKQHQYGVSQGLDVGTMNTTSIPSGKYQFIFSLNNSESREMAKSDRTFFIFNPHLKTEEIAVSTFQSTDLDGLSREELSEEFDQIKYFATGEEIRFFSKIENMEGMKEFLAGIWTRIESGRLGRAPIRRVDYLRNVEYANEAYREMGRDGYKTDRGRVFLLYGKPDHIERYPSVAQSKPYEEWNYYSIEGGVLFIFIDRLGYGQYQLVHSTKRGELRDDNWRQYLR